MLCSRPAVAAGLVVLSALASHGEGGVRRQDRPAYEIPPDRAPVWLEDAIFFESGPMLSLSVRNREAEAAYVTLGVYAFDSAERLRATARLCLGDPVGGTSRARVNRPLEFRDVTTREHVVVTVLEVVTTRAAWRLREPEGRLLDVARRRADGYGVRLSMTREAAAGLPDTICPCEEPVAEAGCRRMCEDGLAAYTSSPWFPGCTSSCTCG